MSRIACSTDGYKVPSAVRERMTDSAAHHGTRAGVMCLPWEMGGVLSGINFSRHNARSGLERTSWQYNVSGCFLYRFLHTSVQTACEDCNACGYKNSGSGAADSNVGAECNFWSSTSSSTSAFNWNVNTTNGNLNENLNTQSNGLSVRLFRTRGSVAVRGSF